MEQIDYLHKMKGWKLHYIINVFDVTVEEAEANMIHKDGILTAATEIAGDKCIKEYDLWEKYFPGYLEAEKNKDVDLQKSGVDYIITDSTGNKINIDVKCCIGDNYNMSSSDLIGRGTKDVLSKKGLTLEIVQKDSTGSWIFTNHNKATDYFLYIIMDIDGIFSYLMPFEEARRICLEYRPYLTHNVEGRLVETYYTSESKYYVHLSGNGSGRYIKYPVDATKLS